MPLADLAAGLVLLQFLSVLDQHAHVRFARILDDHDLVLAERVEGVLHDDDEQDPDHHQKEVDEVDDRKQWVVFIVMVEKTHQFCSPMRSMARSS